jgi:HK97 family phage major capsid protein
MADLEQVLETISADLKRLGPGQDARTGSRFVGAGADPRYAEHVARGGNADNYKGDGRVAVSEKGNGLSRESRTGNAFLQDVKAARRGDPQANARLEEKGWVEGTPGSGGFFVSPQVLPGYLESRRASSPLRDRCATFVVDSDEVWVVVEGNTVTVQHVAEAATKPDSTGSITQKVSTVFKVAGTSHVSDELLADSNGNAADLVSRQFAVQIGIAIDQAIISGTGTGQPTGIRNTAGITSTAVDGQTGQLLYNSILKAQSRLQQVFYEPDTLVVHPRDLVKFDLAIDSQGRYLFEGGLASQLRAPLAVIPDANVPTTLGAGTNESIAILGAFRLGAYYFERSALTIDTSSDAAFLTDETIFRAVERYGFCVVVPSAFQILTGILP